MRIPGPAQGVFRRGVLCYLAVETSWGPHLTPVVYAWSGGRLWVTTARRSVKARRWRRDHRVAGLIITGTGANSQATFRGRVNTFDAFDPLSWPGAMVSGPRLIEAATLFSLKNARFFGGYAVDAGRVPLAWTPPGRVFAAIRPAEGRVLGDGGWGAWRESVSFADRYEPLSRARHLDLGVPDGVRARIGAAGSGALALQGPCGITVLPVAWRRVGAAAAYEAVLPADTLRLACADSGSPAALTVDHASSWRAADMAGMLMQGTTALFSPKATKRGRRALLDRLNGDPDMALVRLRPHRVVWWEGWTSGSVSSGGHSRQAQRRVAG